jgi:5-methylcytosine-specific restriction endonuclease McrA
MRWKVLCAHLRPLLPPICHICGKPIDRLLPARHRLSWTLDHVISIKERPDLALEPSNLKPAHWGCNSAKGAGKARVRAKNSRPWI